MGNGSHGRFVVFIQPKGTNHWSIEARDFSKFLDILGVDVVAAFARCFVHADRLVSLTSFGYNNSKVYAEGSPAFHRNLQTMVWFVVGTLRELALSIRELRTALARRGLLDPNSAPWVKLRDLETRWEDDPFYREMRNKVAFHVDPTEITKGLEALREQDRVIIVQGEGEKQDHTSLRLGLEALLVGCVKSVEDFDRFTATVANDHGKATDAISEAFAEVLGRVGMRPAS